MKLFATVLAALALLAGFAGGLRAYSVSADAASGSAPRVAAPHQPKAQPVRPGVVVRWAPCRAPAVREGKACVTHVTRTVTVPVPGTSSAAAAAASRYHDDGGHHEGGGHDGGGHDD